MLKITALTPLDADKLAPIAHRIFVETFLPTNDEKNVFGYADAHLTADSFHRELADPNYFTFGCFIDQKLVGYIQMLFNNNEVYDGINLELKRFYLLADYHGRGFADQMMAVCEQKARDLGYGSFWLGVWEKNYRAQRFYEKCGFKKISSHEFVMGDEAQTDLIFAKSLS